LRRENKGENMLADQHEADFNIQGRESCVGRRRSAMANMMASIFNAVRRKCDELSPNRENVILIVIFRILIRLDS
ncbi:unnamed protein product, partial [Nesidiocoris tenuis]